MNNNLSLKFKNNTKGLVSEKLVANTLKSCLEKYHQRNSTEISVLIVGNKTIRALNKQYRHKDYVTDVLSFPQLSRQELNTDYYLLGDIVICWLKLASQAKIAGHSKEKELQLLLEHSFKHLIGIHHKND